MENLLRKIMSDNAARVYMLELENNADLAGLVDQHKLFRLQGDSRALAIEYHIRCLAVYHFHRGDVLAALSAIERQLKTVRPMGTGGSSDLKNIARHIEENYAIGWFTELPETGQIEFKIDGFTVRCKNSPASVAVTVAKFRRGLPRRATNPTAIKA
jgi:hypothetical protein